MGKGADAIMGQRVIRNRELMDVWLVDLRDGTIICVLRFGQSDPRPSKGLIRSRLFITPRSFIFGG